MNRSSSSRANQNGPEEYGFRGNAQNLDLNRDFIKMDSKNMFVFAKIFHGLDPDVFIDTHVSNGADYQYTLTYIASVKERMAPSMAALVHDEMIPDMGKSLEKRDCDWVPYVNLKAAVPDSGITVFNDLPRYSMGYTSLFHTISFTVETHMLKPFAQRAKATLKFLEECVNWTSKNTVEIETARREAFEYDLNNDYFLFNYQRTDHQDSILFKGFEHSYPISEVTGLPRLKYHRDQPFERYVPYFNVYVAKDSIKVPEFLIVGRQCDEILDRLKANGVEMKTHWDLYYPDLKQWKVESFETWRGPYEGHVGHSNIKVEEAPAFYTMLKDGDVMISLDQRNRRFILNALYPAAPDSYFVWGMMDSYVQQKEHFSSYVFEDIALKLLNNNSDLKKEFEEKKANDSDFAASSRAQLNFIYKRSDYFEPTHNRLPILLRY